jgi:hypothetical protein|tara:strand:- start:1038 stop:1754 length:717 start_codon:yes stop_codon:yes gene_type:complete
MASTYSALLNLELIGSGEQSNAWGNTTNNNLQYGLEFSIAGVYTKNLSSASSPYVLTSAQSISATQADNESRQAAIIFTGHTSNFIIQFLATQKTYFLRNNNSSFTITARLGSSGNTYVIQPSTSVFLATDGTNWFVLQTSGTDWVTKTGNYTSFPGDKIFVNTSSQVITITLPASPISGDEIRIIDLASTFDTNNLTVARNGNKINGQTTDLTVATEDAAFSLVYAGATYGWKLTEK